MWLCWDCVAPYMVMPLVGGASCGESDWTKPRLSMRLGGERQRGGGGGEERNVRSPPEDTEAANASRRRRWRLQPLG